MRNAGKARNDMGKLTRIDVAVAVLCDTCCHKVTQFVGGLGGKAAPICREGLLQTKQPRYCVYHPTNVSAFTRAREAKKKGA